MKQFITLFILSGFLFTTNVKAQYCLLPGRTPYISIQPGITNFKLNTINRTSASVEDMSKVIVVTSDTTVLYTGQTYTVTMTHSRDSINFPTARNNIRVWLDYNNNGSFLDAGETVITSDFKTYGVFTASFTVPATATLGMRRLRATAKMSSDAGHSVPTPCDTPVADPIGYHGEMEDYFVKIMNAPSAVLEVNQHNSNVTIFPNPTGNTITVSFDKQNEGTLSIDLYDMTGKRVGNLLETDTQLSTDYTFNLNNYTTVAGVYFVKVSNGGSASYQKVILTN